MIGLSTLLFFAMVFGIPALIFRAIRQHFLKLLASDNTQLAADQERHGEASCPPEVFSPFHEQGFRP